MPRRDSRIFIKCNSHRAREKALNVIGKRRCYYSWQRSARGYYQVTQDELDKVKDITGVSKLRPPYDDLNPCWDSFIKGTNYDACTSTK